jgi:CheY-like chemotaxis protein
MVGHFRQIPEYPAGLLSSCYTTVMDDACCRQRTRPRAGLLDKGVGTVVGRKSQFGSTKVFMSIRVLIADDHPDVRRGVVQGLRMEADIDVVGEVADGAAAVQLTKELDPDVVIMDVEMPRLNGIEATGRISTDCPGVRVIGLSFHASRVYVEGMLKAGAYAYVLKDDDIEELVKAVKAVCDGGTYFSSHINAAPGW